MNGEGNSIVGEYINQLDDATFKAIDQFFKREATHYELINEQPIKTRLGQTLQELPPEPPSPPFNSIEAIVWSLKFRYWAYTSTPDNESNLHRVRVFVYYHEATEGKTLKHSLGLDKGLLSIVHAFAAKEQQPQNNIVIAHELLHTVGATDKYNSHNEPIYPDGYAEPDKQPLFPQQRAEIMSARIPSSEFQSKMADNLTQCLIGEKTAVEINWIQSAN